MIKFQLIQIPKSGKGGPKAGALDGAQRAHLEAAAEAVMDLHETPEGRDGAILYQTTDGRSTFGEREAKSLNAKLRRRFDSINAQNVRTRPFDNGSGSWSVALFYGNPPANASI